MCLRVLELSGEFALRTLETVSQPVGALSGLTYRTERHVLLFACPDCCRMSGKSGATVAVCSGEASSVLVLTKPLLVIHPPPLLDRHFTPELCLGVCSSLLKRSLPSPFPILVSICLFISLPLPLTTQPPPPFFFLLLQANRSIAKNSSVGLLRIYICK